MKIVFFQAILSGLLLLASPVLPNWCSAQNYQPQYQQQTGAPAQGFQTQGFQARGIQTQPQGVGRYPLYQSNQTPSNFTPSPAYPAANRNQPRIPRFQGVTNQTVNNQGLGNRSFANQSFANQNFANQGTANVPNTMVNNAAQPRIGQPSFDIRNQIQQYQPTGVQRPQVPSQVAIPQVANNFGYPNRFGGNYQDVAPLQEPPSPSNLPIPGGNPAQGNIEQLAPGVQPQVPNGLPYQQQIAPQPGVYPQNQMQPGAGPQYVQPNMQGGVQGGPCYNPSINPQPNPGIGCGQSCCIRPPARCCRPGVWFGSIGGVVFNRDFEDDHLYAYPTGFPLTNSLVSTHADPGTMGGLEASFGRRYCNGFGWEFVYWGVFSEDGVGTASGGNPLTRWRTGNYIDYNVNTMDVYLNAALAYRLTRTNEFHNIELNFFRQTVASCGNCCEPCNTGCNAPQSCAPQQPCGNNYNVAPCNYVAGGTGSFGLGNGPIGYNAGYGGHGGYGGDGGYGQSCGPTCGPACGTRCCRRPRRCWRPFFGRPFKFDVLAGIRFFSFDENLLFESSTTGDYVPHINDINYSVDVNNSMVGVQVGGNIEYCLFPRWTLVGGSRFGVYGNSISQTQQIFGIAGYGVPNVGAWAGQDYNLRSTKTDVAFMGQLDLGLRYAIGCRWNLGFGYRVLAVQGVALAPEQIPYDFSNYQEINYINSNAGLILHGAYARVGFCF